jgi:hypothetical protein
MKHTKITKIREEIMDLFFELRVLVLSFENGGDVSAVSDCHSEATPKNLLDL